MTKNRRGLILVTSLWIAALLTLLSVGLAQRLSFQIRLISSSRDMLKGRFCADSAVNLAKFVLLKDINNYDSLNEIWSGAVSESYNTGLFEKVKMRECEFSVSRDLLEGRVVYGLSDEESKININTSTTAFLQAFFKEQGFNNSREIASSIIDWIDADNSTSFDGAENEYYSTLDPGYQCKNAPLSVIYELKFIRGMDEEKFNKIMPFITVFGDGKINVNTVSPQVLASLLISRGSLDSTARKLAREIDDYRKGPDGLSGTPDDAVFTNLEGLTLALSVPQNISEFQKCQDMLKFQSEFFKADIKATAVNSGLLTRVEAVINRNSQGVSPEVVSWAQL